MYGTKVEVSESAGEGVRGVRYWELVLVLLLEAVFSAVRVGEPVRAVTIGWTGGSGISPSGAWTMKWETAWKRVIIVCVEEGF